MLRTSHNGRWAAQQVAPYLRSYCNRRGYATVTDLQQYPKIGEQLHGFTLKRVKEVPELELTALHLQHDQTGAEYLHVARDDNNNVFSIGFKTNPPDNTGVPHILEHTTLCGSKNYPVRDPFFKMLPRSLSNFMNAMTYADHTDYPFATTNRQDFKNLMSVYFDATLRPLLKENDFTQEGWRIGPENPRAAVSAETHNATDKRLVFKGVVYNEMKGQTSDAGYLYYEKWQDHMFPDINNSGGDPQKMTDLTWDQLRKFHADHYHPSNAKIFTYGNFALADHLSEANRQLSGFERIAVDQDIKRPISFEDGPKYVTVNGPVDPLVPLDQQYKTSTSWATHDTSDVHETFALGVLSTLLMDGYGSPLYRALIESGLGSDFSPITGMDSAGKIGIFSVGLSGVKKEDVPKVKEATFQALAEAKANGFDQIKVDGILHSLTLGLKHKTANFGMGIYSKLTSGLHNGVDPFDALAWDSTVSAFQKKYAQGGYLESLLEKYLLNDKTLTFTMAPYKSFAQERADEENQRLATKILETTQKFTTEAEAQRYLEDRELELLEEQEKAADQDLSVLPTVHVEDIPRRKEQKQLRNSTVGDINVQWREAPTNGLTYFRAINTFEQLPHELRELIPLFTDSVMRLGTRNETMEQLEDLIKLNTGGINLGYHTTTSAFDTSKYEEGLAFSGYALDHNIPTMYELLHKLIKETHFDGPEAAKNIRELLQASASNAVNGIASAGHRYASLYAASSLTPEGSLKEQTRGLTQTKLITSLASRPATDSLQDVIDKLKIIQRFALSNSSSLRVALTCAASSSDKNEAALKHFLSHLPNNVSIPAASTSSKDLQRNSKTFFPLPYQVYYSAFAMPTIPYTNPSGAPLQILSQMLTNKHLHHEIREKGGAYGGGASASGLGGLFSFYSYRDPNPQNTMRIIENAGRWATQRHWTDRDLEEAKLSVFQSVDAPQSVSDEGMTRFLTGVTEEMQQVRREQLLDVKVEDVQRVAEEFLVSGISNGRVAVLGEKKDWVNEEWDVKDMGMQEALKSVGQDAGEQLQQAVAS